MDILQAVSDLFLTEKQRRRRDQLRAANRRSYRKRKGRNQQIINKIENALLEVILTKLKEAPD